MYPQYSWMSTHLFGLHRTTKNPQTFSGCGFLDFFVLPWMYNWCRRRDSNSYDRGSLPPQDSVSTNSTTSALTIQFYGVFDSAGAAGCSGAGGFPVEASCFGRGAGLAVSLLSTGFSTLTFCFFNSFITDPVLELDE